MAETGHCRRPASSHSPAQGSVGSVGSVLGMASALEDVLEEEDFFLPEDRRMESGGVNEDEPFSSITPLESEFLPLTIHKQVSYRYVHRIK